MVGPRFLPYRRAWLRWDLLAGLTAAAVVVSQAVAYASLAGAGMGLFIAASQLGKVLGVPAEGDNFFAKVWSALGQLGDANPATVALALGGLALLLALRRWPRACPARWSWSPAYPAGGGTSQTAVNHGAGARTQVAELVTAAMAVLALTLLADLLADLAEDLHGQGRILWVVAPSQRPLEMLRRAAELLGRTDLQADTGRLGVRLFPTLEEAVAAHRHRPQP